MWRAKKGSGVPGLVPLAPTLGVAGLLLAHHLAGAFSQVRCQRRIRHDLVRIRRDKHEELWTLRANDNNGGGDGKIDWNPLKNPKISKLPSYSDDWLLKFHNKDQSEKQLVTNSLAAWNEAIRNKQATIVEWQDSFQRNDLADFTPPMSSSGLNCLMVGGDFDVYESDDEFGGRRLKLPWEDIPEAKITSLRVLEDDSIVATNAVVEEDEEEEALTIAGNHNNKGRMVRTELIPSIDKDIEDDESASAGMRVRDPNKPVATYDCIVDQGLMERVLPRNKSNSNDYADLGEQTVRELLEEAALAMKEFGIYVLVTTTLTEESERLLEKHGLAAGLEWQFRLDGISNESQVVSVARRFNTGEMPRVGRLSRYQP